MFPFKSRLGRVLTVHRSQLVDDPTSSSELQQDAVQKRDCAMVLTLVSESGRGGPSI